MSKEITVAIIGVGDRGTGFAAIINELSPLAKVVAVAEPRDEYRKNIQDGYGLPDDRCFTGWKEFIAAGKICDAVIIATLDQEHRDPAIACQEMGYHMMLEKPMAVSLQDCEDIANAQTKHNVITVVCHSLRYHKGFAKVKELVQSGRIGDIVSLDQLEKVEINHQAHSFVRGNWGNQSRSTFMLMAKSCHDIDYISYLIDEPCKAVSSFGSLKYFNEANAPEGSTERCTDACTVEHSCQFSALKVYMNNRNSWPASSCSYDHSADAHMEALKTGPYGRCVYRTDNDVVDHQVVNLLYDKDITATFTMTAFTQGGGRELRVHGTKGELSFDESTIIIKDFASLNTETITIGPEKGGHGGGDGRVVRSWIDAIHANDQSLVISDVHESLRTHRIVFAAEESRLSGEMIKL
ncbi:MAG: Gfo/Idh/MocA family oxidoreductase [Lentisphaeria bacterium]|nr:Gfo/Idh/MocA family oxidoreductase [Lentisphaeria bacterium]NQZ69964.1 Gfo/Idh/MocA family oxidoreductase [Lentisphaeria bacterium]